MEAIYGKLKDAKIFGSLIQFALGWNYQAWYLVYKLLMASVLYFSNDMKKVSLLWICLSFRTSKWIKIIISEYPHALVEIINIFNII